MLTAAAVAIVVVIVRAGAQLQSLRCVRQVLWIGAAAAVDLAAIIIVAVITVVAVDVVAVW